MTESGQAGEPRRERKQRGPEGLSPVRAFFVVGAIAAIVPLGLLATRDEATPAESPGAVRSPDFSLTDAEAIAEFERLHDLQVQAYENRDLSLIPRTYTSDSPVAGQVQREITELLRDDVTAMTDFATKNVVVEANGDNEITLRQSVLVDAAFFNRQGDEISTEAPVEHQQIRWVLRRSNSTWLIHDAIIVSSRALKEGAK